MSFRTQRLANRFPLWTKIRKDPSSMGSRLLDTFAEGLEENAITAQRLVEDVTLGKRNIGRSFLYEMVLDGDNVLEPVQGSNGYSWEYPVLTGTVDSVAYVVSRADSLSTLMMAYPTRVNELKAIAAAYRVVWLSTAPFDYNPIATPERLWVVVVDSTFYVDKTPHKHHDKSGLAAIRIRGIDENYNEFTETLNLRDDGIFITSFAFREVLEVTREGFDGDVRISAGPVALPYEIDPYRVLVLQDLEGPLQLKLDSSDELFEGNAITLLTYQTNRFKLGRQYRTTGVETVTNTEELGSFLLKDKDGASYTAMSLAVSPANTYLYVLDSIGKVHVYDHGLPEFLPPAVTDTITTYVELEVLNPYAQFGRTEYLWTRFARMRFPLSWLEIKRITPSAVTEYLQADHTWSATPYKQTLTPVGRPRFDQWVDYRFSTEYTETGVYEYIATAKTAVDQTVFSTQVYCGDMTAVATITAVTGDTIYFADNGNLVIDDGAELHYFEEHTDQYIIDEQSSRIWLSDSYDSVEVT